MLFRGMLGDAYMVFKGALLVGALGVLRRGFVVIFGTFQYL